jgi:hypothetical protein
VAKDICDKTGKREKVTKREREIERARVRIKSGSWIDLGDNDEGDEQGANDDS